MNIKIISALILAGACSVSVSNLSASNFSYSYIEGGVGDFIDEADDPTFFVGGSYNVSSNINLLASYDTTTLTSDGLLDLDFDKFKVGVGYHTPVSDSTDMTANVQYIGTDVSITNGFNSEEIADGSGYGIGLGLRHKVSDSFEANANVDYMDVEDGKDTAFTVGARYYFNQKISANLAYTSGDFDGASGSVRFDF